MVDITGKPREYITPKWSKSVVVNAFRVYEYLFGRRAGIRFEGGSYKDEYGHDCWKFGTWENVLTFAEYVVRDFFKGLVPSFEIVRVPQLVTPNGIRVDSPFRFAIAFDNAQSVTGTTTLSCVVSGSNLIMVGSVNANSSGSSTTNFNGSSMTNVAFANPANQGVFLIAPTTGTHNMITTSGGNGASTSATYSGVAQTSLDMSGTTSVSGTSGSVTINTSTANCWMVIMVLGANGTPTAGTNTTGRSLNASGSGQASIGDSNGTITTGGFTLTLNGFSSGLVGSVAYTFTQVSAPTVNSGFLTFM